MPHTPDQTQIVHDRMDPARAAALHATLGRPGRPPGPDEPLPPFWHMIYFWDVRPPQDLGRDGHPRTGLGLIPDLGLPQRMWAGGKLEFLAPLRLGQPAEKRSMVEDVQIKQGRSGKLGFIHLRHDIIQQGRLCVTERQDLVYKSPTPPDAGRQPPVASRQPEGCKAASFSTTLLFRYSALTMNGHRIHYDADYARGHEGYAGLVVHGPLLAQMLIHYAEEVLGPLRSFGFRATSALMVHEEAELCHQGNAFWVRGPDGRLCMEATAH